MCENNYSRFMKHILFILTTAKNTAFSLETVICSDPISFEPCDRAHEYCNSKKREHKLPFIVG